MSILKKLPRGETANQFYCDHYHYFFYGLMVSVGIMIVAVGILLYETLHQPLPPFSAKDQTGKSMQLVAYRQPNLLSDTLLRWAGKGATLAYTFDYVNYNKQLNEARPYFTEDGWRDYQSSVSDLIDTIVQNQLIVNGVISAPPVIVNQGDYPGQGYIWRVQIPFLVTYQSANATSLQRFTVVLTLVHVPTTINPQGIGIDQFVMVKS